MAGPLPWLTCGGRPLGQRALGLVLIFATAVIWVAASFLSSLLVSTAPGASPLHAPPLLLTYLATSVFTLFLPLVHGKRFISRRLAARREVRYKVLSTAAADDDGAPLARAGSSGSAPGSGGGSSGGGGGDGFAAALDAAEAEVAAAAGGATGDAAAAWAAEKEAAMAAARCFLLWFGAQLAFNVSLSMTSVTSNTILSSASSLFTFALSMVFLKEPYTAAKLASIVACMAGTVLVTFSDDMAGKHGSSSGGAPDGGGSGGGPGGSEPPSSSGAGQSVWGDLLCLFSAMLYAGYTIVLRAALPDDDEADVALFFGYIGLFCTALFAPVLAGMAAAGALDLSRVTRGALGLIFLQGVLNYAFSDYLWAHAVLLLGPTLATLGLSVQIPIAAVADALLGRAAWLRSGATAAMTLGGTALILAGFFAGNAAGGGEGQVPGGHHRGEGGVDGAAGAGGVRSAGGGRSWQEEDGDWGGWGARGTGGGANGTVGSSSGGEGLPVSTRRTPGRAPAGGPAGGAASSPGSPSGQPQQQQRAGQPGPQQQRPAPGRLKSPRGRASIELTLSSGTASAGGSPLHPPAGNGAGAGGQRQQAAGEGGSQQAQGGAPGGSSGVGQPLPAEAQRARVARPPGAQQPAVEPILE